MIHNILTIDLKKRKVYAWFVAQPTKEKKISVHFHLRKKSKIHSPFGMNIIKTF